MNIVVDIGHPAHVHFFKKFIKAAREQGHHVLITAAEKEINLDLLDHYEFFYVRLGKVGQTLLAKFFSLFILNFNMFRAVYKFKPDIFFGIASIRAAQVAWLMRRKSYIFDDTEQSPLEQLLYRPFATKICSPTCFEKQFGAKHVLYNGYHELAYLHPNRFQPKEETLEEIGLKKGEKLFIVRFISWGATHDVGHKGFSYQGKLKLIDLLSRHGRVIITSEERLPDAFEPYRLNVSPTKIHDLLSFATLYVGEGATMASEAAVLGTPVVFVRTLVHGYLKELQERFQLLFAYENEIEALAKVESIIGRDLNKEHWDQKRQQLLSEKIDTTQFMLDLIAQ